MGPVEGAHEGGGWVVLKYSEFNLNLSEFISSNSRQYYIMLPSIPQNDADLITSRDEPPIRTQTCNPV